MGRVMQVVAKGSDDCPLKPLPLKLRVDDEGRAGVGTWVDMGAGVCGISPAK